MNILLIGGAGSLINNLIIKLNKEGHRIYLLTGNKSRQSSYQKVFERYNFGYDSPCLNEIFESVSPDLTIYMGAFDTNFTWTAETQEKEAARYVSSLTNILMAYARKKQSMFVYLSSHEVYSGNYEEDIIEQVPLSPDGVRSMALAVGENLCAEYRTYQEKDIITVRLDHLYTIPKRKKDIDNICARFCLEALQNHSITIVENNRFSVLYETDAVEFIHRLVSAEKRNSTVYNLASPQVFSEYDIAKIIADLLAEKKEEIEIITRPVDGQRRVLSNRQYDSEFGIPFYCDIKTIIERMLDRIRKKSASFYRVEEEKLPFWQRVSKKAVWFLKAAVPYMENIVIFCLAHLLDKYYVAGNLDMRVDFFLIYVLLFAIFYGQQQALLAAVLSVFSYGMSCISVENGFELVIHSDTYVWIAQLFSLGLVVGYMRDQLSDIRKINAEEKEYLSDQLTDIQDIHTSNVRVKDALETQIINQSDSIGKIYSITSALDQYSSEEVLFYAAEILAKLMKTKDVAIYTVSNADYARLFSYTSGQGKILGNSIRYAEMGELSETLKAGKVYINRQMDERYPLMANAIFENDTMEMMIFVWGLSWEQMTLGQANLLTIISSLIQNAVLRADRYMEALEEKRYVEGSALMVSDAFAALAKAHMKASDKGLTECTMLKVLTPSEDQMADGKLLASKLRLSDYVGILPDGNMYVLLSNTSKEEAGYVIQRFAELGFETEIQEEKIV